MRVLALDAATERCSAALLLGEALSVRTLESGRSTAPQLLQMVEDLLGEAGISLGALDGLAASIGPGAFTGVRISVAVAQGLAFGAGLAVVPISTLEALAMQVINRGAGRVLACLDARMGEVYWGCFAAQGAGELVAVAPAAVGAPSSVRPAGADIYHGVGRGFRAYPQLAALPRLTLEAGDADALPSAGEMAELGARRLEAGAGLDPAALEPLYLRDKVALTTAERDAR